MLMLVIMIAITGDQVGHLNGVTKNVAINATLSNGDLASSEPTFVMTQGQSVTVNSMWVNCGVANRGPTASFRIYVDMADDRIEVYFAFSQVYGGWSGVAQGTWPSRTASLDPPGAASTAWAERWGVLSGYRVPSAGGGFNVVIRVWAEGSNVQVYAGECQFGIHTGELIVTVLEAGYVLVLVAIDVVVVIAVTRLVRRSRTR